MLASRPQFPPGAPKFHGQDTTYPQARSSRPATPAPQTEPVMGVPEQSASDPAKAPVYTDIPEAPRVPRVTRRQPAIDGAATPVAAAGKPAAKTASTAKRPATTAPAGKKTTAKAAAPAGKTAPAAPRVRKARTLAEAIERVPPTPAAPEPIVVKPAAKGRVTKTLAPVAVAPAPVVEHVQEIEGASAPATPLVTNAGAPARRLRILMVASEAVPFAKTGGLADVVAALPKALGALGHDVTVVIPRYRGIPVTGEPSTSYAVSMGGHHYQANVYVQQTSPGVRVALVDHPAFFDRDALYGIGSQDYGDNPRRFAFLCLAALEFARLEGRPVDIVHAHDWQAGLAPVYVKTRYAGDPVLGSAATIFTIHNIAYQGNCSSDWLPQLGLGWELFNTDGLEFWLHASLLKGGVMFADLVTTVSPRYADELMAPEFAFGFEGILRHRAANLLGILNGIDADVWDPAADRYLPSAYQADDLSGKLDAKRVLLDTYGLPTGDDLARRPVVAMISRMVDQKGLDLIASVAEQLPHLGAAFVILGTGEPWYEEMWRSLARRYPDRVGVRIGFDEPLSHVIEAGADLFMMPSRFEPCGLNQMYSLRYGTLPVVRATGGLDDTVQNYDPASGAGNGFKFHDASGEALLGTLRWALHVFHNEPERWRQLQRAGMARDFSWNASAHAYLEAYDRARAQVTGRQGVTA